VVGVACQIWFKRGSALGQLVVVCYFMDEHWFRIRSLLVQQRCSLWLCGGLCLNVGSSLVRMWQSYLWQLWFIFCLMWHYGQRWFSLAQFVEAFVGVVYSLCSILAHRWFKCLCQEFQ